MPKIIVQFAKMHYFCEKNKYTFCDEPIFTVYSGCFVAANATQRVGSS